MSCLQTLSFACQSPEQTSSQGKQAFNLVIADDYFNLPERFVSVCLGTVKAIFRGYYILQFSP